MKGAIKVVYSNLRNVRIIEKSRAAQSMPFPLSLFHREEANSEPEMWIAVYHSEYGKWIVTNDFDHAGMKEEAGKLQIVGYADSLNGIMFVVWEHQVSLGLSHTVMDDIRLNIKSKAKPATDAEWTDWPGDDDSTLKVRLWSEMRNSFFTRQMMHRTNPIFSEWINKDENDDE